MNRFLREGREYLEAFKQIERSEYVLWLLSQRPSAILPVADEGWTLYGLLCAAKLDGGISFFLCSDLAQSDALAEIEYALNRLKALQDVESGFYRPNPCCMPVTWERDPKGVMVARGRARPVMHVQGR